MSATDSQKEITRIENGLYKLDDALEVVRTVYVLLFTMGSEPTSAAPTLAHALRVGEKAVAKARRRLARLKAKAGQQSEGAPA